MGTLEHAQVIVSSAIKFQKIKAAFFYLFILIVTAGSAQSIVQENGRLRVDGNKVVNKNNQSISLAGNSIFWSNFGEGAKFYNAQTVNHLATNWDSDIVRAAMGVENNGGYITNPIREKNKVKAIVDAAINAGVYVIIDWHSHNAELYQSEAIQFFSEMSRIYGNNDHVIYEIYNEPARQTWPTIKSYAEAVIDAIRVNDPDNLIVVGSRRWSQEVEEASINPINKSNIAYALHFYAGTHKKWLRDRAVRAMNNGIALFVTEWGVVDADGDGEIAVAETNLWMAFLKENDISHANWSVSDKAEGASVVASNAGVSGLVNNNLTPTGVFVKEIIETWKDSDDYKPVVNPIDDDDSTTCDAPTAISLPFKRNTSGTFCWVTSGSISFINSWGLNTLEINGVDFTNKWSNQMPARINGNYYITFESSNSWGHFEIIGSGGSTARFDSNSSGEDTAVAFSMYPNPSKGKVNINLSSKPIQAGSMTLYNRQGILLKTWTLKNNKKVVDISSLPAGMYFTRLVYDGRTINNTIVKE